MHCAFGGGKAAFGVKVPHGLDETIPAEVLCMGG